MIFHAEKNKKNIKQIFKKTLKNQKKSQKIINNHKFMIFYDIFMIFYDMFYDFL
jgi:hypothetical protein